MTKFPSNTIVMNLECFPEQEQSISLPSECFVGWARLTKSYEGSKRRIDVLKVAVESDVQDI